MKGPQQVQCHCLVMSLVSCQGSHPSCCCQSACRNSYVVQFGQQCESSTSIKAMLAAFARSVGSRLLNIEGRWSQTCTSSTFKGRKRRQFWCLSVQSRSRLCRFAKLLLPTCSRPASTVWQPRQSMESTARAGAEFVEPRLNYVEHVKVPVPDCRSLHQS